MKLFLRLMAIMATAFVALSCSDNNGREPVEPISRTVLVYMAADNNLSYDSQRDLHEMAIAVDEGALDRGGHLIVMQATERGQKLLEVVKGKNPVTLVEYTDTGSVLTPEFMKGVFSDMRSVAPAESYGLVLWSHATGWMDETSVLPWPSPRSFGLDVKQRMSLAALHDALSGQGFEWIYFDCCHMGTVEVFYELRDCASVFVASPTELPAEGMRYDINVHHFFNPSGADLVSAAKATYAEHSENSFCSMTVVDASRLDYLATATRRVVEESAGLPSDYRGIPFMRRQISPICTIYDMADYITNLSPSAPVLASWRRAYDAAILYSVATPNCLGLDLTAYSGLGSNILFNEDDADLFGYKRYAWWKDVMSHMRVDGEGSK